MMLSFGGTPELRELGCDRHKQFLQDAHAWRRLQAFTLKQTNVDNTLLTNSHKRDENDHCILMPVPKMELGLTTAPFEYLMRNRTVIDVRLDEPEWEVLEVGDHIIFLEDPGRERKLVAKIAAKLHCCSFQELHENTAIQYFRFSSMDEALKHYYRWWSPSEEQKWGVLGLQVDLVNDTEITYRAL